MKLNLTKAWYESEVVDEEVTSITAGIPDSEPFLAEANERRQAFTRCASTSPPFARLINLRRRAFEFSLAELADKADIDLAELNMIEHGSEYKPEQRTVLKLAETLDLPVERLFEISGLTAPMSGRINEVANRFTARSGPVDKLSPEEAESLREYMKYLNDDQPVHSD